MGKFFKNKWVKRVIILLIVICLAFAAVKLFGKKEAVEEAGSSVSTAVVTRRSIVNTVTGSGTVEAYETYNIVPTVNGEIVMCDVEEGEWVEENQVLYKFDTETSDNAISKAENSVENASLSLEQAEENVENLTIRAPKQGVVSNLSLIIGDNASGTVCTITDNTYMIAEIPVNTSAVSSIKKGDRVTVGLEKYMTTMEGFVERVATGSLAGENGAMVTVVEVRIDNPGSIEKGTMASATFHTASGEVEGAEAAELNYPDSAKANAKQSGTVEKLNVKNGDWVNEGDIIAVLENSQVENQLKTAKMNYSDAVSNLSDTRKKAEDYVLTAPIAGKVMEKNYKKGDTVAGSNSTTLMVVADTTRMKFTINVDELDVSKITIGQEVSITADAIEDASFTGVIETVSLLGTSGSGVTYYPVVVRIDEPGDLLPGMNVSAEIIVESAENVVAVPSGAVSYYDGKYYVMVVGEVEGMADRGAMPMERPTGDMDMPMERPTGDMPMGRGEGASEGMPMGRNEGGMPQRENGAQREEGAMPEIEQTLYDEPLQVEVTKGVSDDDYVEITSGLEVGQIVEVAGESGENSQWGSFGGGMPGGGMPMGGMGGNRGGGMPMGGMR